MLSNPTKAKVVIQLSINEIYDISRQLLRNSNQLDALSFIEKSNKNIFYVKFAEMLPHNLIIAKVV